VGGDRGKLRILGGTSMSLGDIASRGDGGRGNTHTLQGKESMSGTL